MARRDWLGVWSVTLLMAGCSTSAPSPSPSVQRDVEPAATPASAVTPTVPEEAPPPSITLSEIGWAHRPVISAKARAQNRKALRLHRAGHYAEAREGFANALELSPDHDMARFNLACALSRLGELEAAGEELGTVLHRDLLRFQGRWRGPDADADLEALRTSPEAETLDRLIDGLRVTYDAAHAQGISAYLFAHEPTLAKVNHNGNFADPAPKVSVAGAWVHDAKRFVPLVREGTFVVLDLPRRRAMTSGVTLVERHCTYDVYLEGVTQVSTSPDPASKIADKVYEDEQPSEDDEGGGYPVLGFAGAHAEAARLDEAFEPPFVRIHPEGGILEAHPPKGPTLAGRMLTVPGREAPIELPPPVGQLFAPVGELAPLFVLQRAFETDNGGVNRIPTFETTVLRVNADTGKTERIAHGRGSGWLTLGPDGSVYIETGGATRRWATPTATTSEPTMERLHIAQPVGHPECLCCG